MHRQLATAQGCAKAGRTTYLKGRAMLCLSFVKPTTVSSVSSESFCVHGKVTFLCVCFPLWLSSWQGFLESCLSPLPNLVVTNVSVQRGNEVGVSFVGVLVLDIEWTQGRPGWTVPGQGSLWTPNEGHGPHSAWSPCD